MGKRLAIVFSTSVLLFAIASPARADFSKVENAIDWSVPKLNDMWNRTLTINYRSPSLPVKLYRSNYFGGGQNYITACNPGRTDTMNLNAFYCHLPSDEFIYMDYPFMHNMLLDCNEFYVINGQTSNRRKCYDNDNDPNTTGDGAVITILAHEWGHHIQNLQGWPYQKRNNGEFAAFELQADCFAGLFMRFLANQDLITQDDLDEALFVMRGLGDTPGTLPWSEGAHGGPDQREGWFAAGYNQYDFGVCNSTYGSGSGAPQTRPVDLRMAPDELAIRATNVRG
jgi:predicted metalloprotease